MTLNQVNLKNEFFRLQDTCYLDHVGAGLYANSQMEAISADLKSTLYSNPHSSGTSSIYCKDNIEQIRYRILEHFGTTPEDYHLIFTAGATHSLKIVVECFDWGSLHGEEIGHFIYTRDNHTSVLGLREIVDPQKVKIHCLEHEEAFRIFAGNAAPSHEFLDGNSLFVYSAQCNFSGCKYPLMWINKVHDGILNDSIVASARSKWFCLLDAASYVPTSELNLSHHQADFVVLSFYKMFGYPTGLGALLVRKSSSHVLQKRYFGGGTILMTLSDERLHRKRENITEAFEDGTVNYLAILALSHGFDTLQRLGGDMRLISTRVFSLAQYLHEKFLTLHHSNGNPAVKLYRDSDYSDCRTQGGVVNFNLLRDNSQYIGFTEVSHIASLFGIQLRTGCFCNPGACQRHLGLTNEQLKRNFEKGHSCADPIDLIDGFPTGSVRVSFGYSSTEDDANKLFDMVLSCFVSKPAVFKSPVTWAKEARILKAKFEPFCRFHCTTLSQNSADVLKPESISRTLVSKHFLGAKLMRISVFPIKSCAAFDVSERWPITKTGLMYDREWMIISANGVALTQKQAPRMCLIVPRICLARKNLILEFGDSNTSSSASISVNLHKVSNSSSEINRICWSKVCGDRVSIIDWGDDVAEWLQTVLQMPGVRLVKVMKRTSSGTGATLSLTNQAQYLLITETSLQWLWERTTQSAFSSRNNMAQRFRSNFIISGSVEVLEEFTWKQIYIGNLCFEVKGACNRCHMICIDQSSGEKDREPLTALASAQDGKIKFGIYLNLVGIDGPSYVKVGDDIAVVYNS
ncbi:hypothetical protein V9T40_004801 [Parthenolecanium corni]|uniref:Molybdenum cofactor sulfurase n=1 Tax=Parthenolecanium corni TaxID=536013 RepID=A0AAN9TGY9_9HEMI